MKNKNNNLFVSSMILSVCFVVFGLLLLIFPNTVITVVAYVLAIGVAAMGLYGLYKFFISKDESIYTKYGLAYGILFIILALFIVFKKDDFTKILPYVVGAIILINCTLKVDYIIKLKKDNNENWKVICCVTAICFLLGIVLLFFPLQSLDMLVRIIGLVIVFYSILDIITTYIIKTNIDKKPEAVISISTVTVSPDTNDESTADEKDKETTVVEKPEVKKAASKSSSKAPKKKTTTSAKTESKTIKKKAKPASTTKTTTAKKTSNKTTKTKE